MGWVRKIPHKDMHCDIKPDTFGIFKQGRNTLIIFVAWTNTSDSICNGSGFTSSIFILSLTVRPDKNRIICLYHHLAVLTRQEGKLNLALPLSPWPSLGLLLQSTGSRSRERDPSGFCLRPTMRCSFCLSQTCWHRTLLSLRPLLNPKEDLSLLKSGPTQSRLIDIVEIIRRCTLAQLWAPCSWQLQNLHLASHQTGEKQCLCAPKSFSFSF